VLVVIQRRAGIEIALVDSRSGAIRTIKSLDWRSPMRAALSPDGRWIAYDFQVERDKPQRDLYLLAADGSAEHRLTEDPANDLHAVWMSNQEIVFASMRGGSVGLWRVHVKDGRALRDPEMVKADMTPGFYPMGVTANGTLFYSQDTGGGDIFTVAFDPIEARTTGEPRKFVQRYQGFNAAAHFSPAGDAMIYTSRRDALSIGHTLGVYLHDLKSGSERHLKVYTTRPFAQPRVSPDGKHAIVWTRTIRGGERIMLVDLAAATNKVLVQHNEALLSNAAWSRDGRSIYYFRNNDMQGSSRFAPRIVRYALDSGQEEVVHRFDLERARWVWAISPDERFIAYAGSERGSKEQRLRVAPLGGQSRELVRLAAPQAVSDRTGIVWTPDGRQILYGVAADTRWVGDPNVTLYAVSASGGLPRETGLRLNDLRHVSFLPDGRTLAFTAGPNVFNEVWIMENLKTASTR
jgi:Tol biopolymer transport system component